MILTTTTAAKQREPPPPSTFYFIKTFTFPSYKSTPKGPTSLRSMWLSTIPELSRVLDNSWIPKISPDNSNSASCWLSYPPWAMSLIFPFILVIIVLLFPPCIIILFQRFLQEKMNAYISSHLPGAMQNCFSSSINLVLSIGPSSDPHPMSIPNSSRK